MRTLALILVFLCSVALGASSVFGQNPTPEPFVDLYRNPMRGEPPSQNAIESAYRACLKQIDDDAAELGAKNRSTSELIKAQSDICRKNRTECIANPRSIDCGAFVDDYGSE